MENYIEFVSKFFEKFGFSEKDVETMYSTDSETSENRVTEFMEKSGHDINEWFELAVELGSFAPHLALPIFEELYRHDCNYGDEANIGAMYYEIGQPDKACEWYKRGMERNLRDDHLYLGLVSGYLESVKRCYDELEGYQEIPDIILHLLPYCSKKDAVSGCIWKTIADIYSGYYGLDTRPDIVLACLIEAKKCLTSKHDPDVGPRIDFMRKSNPQLYERAVRLDVREAIRRNLTDGEQVQPEQEAQEQQQPSSLTLRVGDMENIDNICSKLAAMGYCKSEYAFMQGQYARRGGIVDVFPYGSRLPYRIDLLDDGIDSIRTFDSRSMLSIDRCDSCVITPKPQPAQPATSPKQPSPKKPKSHAERRRQLPQPPVKVEFSGRYYRIIIYIMAAIILLLCCKLHLRA